MNAVAHIEQADTPEVAAIIQVIERAALNPAVDIDKMERLLQMQERVMARNAEQAFNAAMSAAQAALGPVATDAANPQTKSRYASYAALDRAVRPIYTAHGFSLSFNTGESPIAEHLRVICRVAHGAGHSEHYHVDMPADGKGAKGGDVMTKTHATGAAMSYGQRYLLKLIFNIAVGDDNDGNGQAQRGPSGAVEAAVSVIQTIESLGDLKAWKAKNGKVMGDLPGPDQDEIIRVFNRRFKTLTEGAAQ